MRTVKIALIIKHQKFNSALRITPLKDIQKLRKMSQQVTSTELEITDNF